MGTASIAFELGSERHTRQRRDATWCLCPRLRDFRPGRAIGRDSARRPMDHPRVTPTLVETYRARTPGSARLFERAAAALPGGSTRTTIFSAPYPPYMVRGEGIHTRDVDGNEYRDFLGNYTSLILGHAHPEVVAAVTAQVRRGSAFAAPTETEIELAEEIRRRLPSIERVRFTNSGTEAT